MRCVLLVAWLDHLTVYWWHPSNGPFLVHSAVFSEDEHCSVVVCLLGGDNLIIATHSLTERSGQGVVRLFHWPIIIFICVIKVKIVRHLQYSRKRRPIAFPSSCRIIKVVPRGICLNIFFFSDDLLFFSSYNTGVQKDDQNVILTCQGSSNLLWKDGHGGRARVLKWYAFRFVGNLCESFQVDTSLGRLISTAKTVDNYYEKTWSIVHNSLDWWIIVKWKYGAFSSWLLEQSNFIN